MPDTGIYIQNDSLRNLNADLFADDARSMVGDAWQQQATAALPGMVADAQDRADEQARQQQAAAQAQRDAAATAFTTHAANVAAGLDAQQQATQNDAADQFIASVPQQVASTPGVDPDLVAHLGGGHAASPPTDGSDTGATSPADSTTTPSTTADGLTPSSPVTAPLSDPFSSQQPVTPAAPAPIVPPPLPVAPSPPPPPAAPVSAPLAAPAVPAVPVAPAAPSTPIQPATPTTAGISGGGDLSGRVGAAGQAIMSAAADTASWLGDQGQKALQAVLLTEGGLNGARGDNGQSAGPLQFYTGGQLANFAQQHGMSQDQAMAYVEANPDAAVQWAIGTPDKPGYLGAAIQAGLQKGLTGPDLATYAQQHGQVSVSPERAGANWQSLFGAGGAAIQGAVDGGVRVVQAAVNNVVNTATRPSQFAAGLSTADAYAACGPVAALAFAHATGRNPTAQEAVDLAKSVGWTAANGMAGPQSEVSLLSKMGVTSHLEAGADPSKIAQDVQNGNPVIISTPGHYFVADGFDPQKGFHVGTSGTDLKAGSEWMTLGQMQNVMGTIQGTLYLDRQPGDGPSVASQMQTTPVQPEPVQPATGLPAPVQPQGPLDAFKNKLNDAFDTLLAPLQNFFGQNQPAANGAPTSPLAPVTAPLVAPATSIGSPMDALQTVGNAIDTADRQYGPNALLTAGEHALGQNVLIPAINDIQSQPQQNPLGRVLGAAAQAVPNPVGQAVLGTAANVLGGPGAPESLQILKDMGAKYGTWDSSQYSPEDQQAAGNAMVAVGGILGEPGASYDRFGVQEGFVPPAAKVPAAPQYDQYGVEVGFQPPPAEALAPAAAPVEAMVPTPANEVAAPAPVVDVTSQLGRNAAPLSAEERALRASLQPAPPTADQFMLPTTPPTPDAVPLTPDGVVAHLETLDAQKAANDARIEDLENRLQGGRQGVVHPPGTIGWTDAEVIAYARQNNLNPYSEDGWPHQAGDAANIAQNRPSIPASAKQTPTQMRAELTQLRTENDALHTVTEQVWANPDATYYAPPVAGELPFDYPAGSTDAASAAASGQPAAIATANLPATDLERGTEGATQGGSGAGPQAAPVSAAPAPGPANPPAVAPTVPSLGLRAPAGTAPTPATAVPTLGLNAPTAPTATGAGAPPVPPGQPPTLPPPTGPLVQANLPGIPPPTPGQASLADVFRAYHTYNVVSGLPTLTHVTVNSIIAPAWSFATRSAADIAGGTAGLVTGGRVGLDTGFSRVQGASVGLGAGLADSGRAIAQAFADHFSNPNAVFNRLPNNPVTATILRAQSVPAALHGIGMSFAQNTIMKVEVGRLAGEEATHLGLQGQAWANHVANAINNPTGAIATEAQGIAQRAALRGDLGTTGAAFQRFVNNVPYVGNTLFPVLKIGANVLSQGIEKSPIGLAGTAFDVARAGLAHAGPYAQSFAGNGAVTPLGERLTNNLAGTALTAWLATKALDGTITGDGPADPGQKAELMAQGWQPNSVYLPGRGYIDYHALGPLAMPFALAGSYGDAVKYGGQKGAPNQDTTAIAGEMAKQMGKYLEDSTGMRTVGQLYDIFHTQGFGGAQIAKSGAQFGSSLLGGFVPESALVRGVATATDPNARRAVAQAGDIGSLFRQDLSMGIPGLREQNAPVAQDILGRPEANNQAGLGVMFPRTGTGTPDPTISLMQGAGVKFPALPSQIAVSSKYAVDLTPEEKLQYQSLRGQFLQQALGDLPSNLSFRSAPVAQQQKILQRAFALADQATAKTIVSQMPEDQLVERVMANRDRRAPAAFATP